MRKYLSHAGVVLALASALAACTAGAQTQTEQPPPAATSPQPASPATQTDTKQPAPAAATPLTPQQAQLQAQIDKLYQLAQDLKTAVAKSNKDTLSIDVIKKADAVEKAAKNLKDQMKTSPASDHH